jgi:NAD(P)-dependent dehydrogenase (short-subunit alcohol dehydrogenase family)
MRARGRGAIVNVASDSAFTFDGSSIPYVVSKAGLVALTRAAAAELGRYGVCVNAVAPGWVRTPMTEDFLVDSTPEMLARVNPLARVGDPGEIANFVLYLATEAPPFLTGGTLFIDGGQTAAAPMP